MITGTNGARALRIHDGCLADPMVTEAEGDILRLGARVLGFDRPSWTSEVAWRPMLQLALRSSRATGVWLRLADELQLVPGRGATIGAGTREWLRSVPADADGSIDETHEGVRAVGLPIDATEPELGTVGLLLPEGRKGLEHLAVLKELSRSLKGGLDLWREARINADALDTLRVLSRAVSNMQLGLTLTDAKGRIVYTNPAEASMHGYEPEELIGRPGSILAPPDLRQEVNFDRNRRDTRWTRESVNRHRDGHDFPVLLWSDVIQGQHGEFAGVVTCSENLAPRRAMEAALQRSETMFRAIFDNAPVGLALIGHDTWIIRANPRLAAMLGLDDEPTIERKLVDFLHPDDAPAAREFYASALSGFQGPPPRLDHRMVAPRGSYLWVQATLSPVTDSAGREQLWIALIEDTTKRRALEEELRHSQKMEAVGRLAGGVAHDFNNLLTAIVGITELLLLEAGGSHSMADDLSEIHRAAVTAADLTRQLLAFSRRQITHHQVQNLNVIVRDSENMLRRLVGDEIELVLDLDEKLDPLVGDQSQIEQVILNLLVNARDATPSGGRIDLMTRNVVGPHAEVDLPPSGGYVELSVSDTGSGMDAATLEQIFDPFFTTKPKGRGTGLGLSTVYGIVKQGGGHIWVDSVVGRGTEFRVWFPALAAGKDAPAPAPPAPTVLVLIGNEARNVTISQSLHEAGIRVLTPEDAAEAIEVADTYGDRIDLLLVDDLVFGGDGAELALRLRDLREDMKVVVLGAPQEAHTDAGLTWVDPAANSAEILEAIRPLLQDRKLE